MIRRNISTLELFFIFKNGTPIHNCNISKNNRICTVELNKRWVLIPTLQIRVLRDRPYPFSLNSHGIQIHTHKQVMLSQHPATADIILINLENSSRNWPVTSTRKHQHWDKWHHVSSWYSLC